ncbi:hypothetical protein MMC28_008217 [Mycoblastus sanguinarius]|nr:hypothetical protein [Mycoblastus sanguinarius]
MAIFNIALLSALLPAVLAMPQHGHSLAHGPYKGTGSRLPSGIFPTGGPFAPSGAPFPVGNSTAGGPTGTGTGGPVTIQSTINLIPQPVTTNVGGIGQSPASTGGSGDSDGGAPGSPSGGSGLGQAASTCGPPTVTVTQANTVTVTVPANPSQAPAQSGAPAQSSAPAPFPVAGNSTVPIASTGTGAPIYTGIPYQAPASKAPLVGSSSGAVANSASSTSVAVSNAASTASVPVNANYGHPIAPGNPYHQSSSSSSAAPTSVVSAPAAPVVSTPAAPVVSSPVVSVVPSSSTTAAAVVPASTTTGEAAPVSSAASPSSSSSSSSTNTNSGVKARGILYAGSGTAALSAANNFGLSNIGWGWNWDSSPAPAVGNAQGTLNVQYVPQLWGTGSGHTSLWDNNSKGYGFLLAFNEPDLCVQGSACIGVSDAVTGWNTYMQPKRSSTVKVGTPATTNDLTSKNIGLDYMTQFLQQCTGCKFDFLCFHWYGSATDVDSTPGSLKATITAYQKLATQYNIPEIWIPEFAPMGASSSDLQAFLTFLDDSSNGVARYALNGLGTGSGLPLTGSIASTYSA